MDPAPAPGARELAAAERKALRRTRVELSSGGRCERAERVLSDQLDGVAAAAEQRFLAAHLARCPRCRTHAAELAAAVQERARPHLRLVPPAPQLPRGAVPAALEAPQPVHAPLALVEEPVTAVVDQPTPLTAKPRRRRERNVPDRPPPTPAHVAVRRSGRNPAIPVLVAALIAAGVIALAIILLMHFNNPHLHAHAPWSNPHAPNVQPAPLSDQ